MENVLHYYYDDDHPQQQYYYTACAYFSFVFICIPSAIPLHSFSVPSDGMSVWAWG